MTTFIVKTEDVGADERCGLYLTRYRAEAALIAQANDPRPLLIHERPLPASQFPWAIVDRPASPPPPQSPAPVEEPPLAWCVLDRYGDPVGRPRTDESTAIAIATLTPGSSIIPLYRRVDARIAAALRELPDATPVDDATPALLARVRELESALRGAVIDLHRQSCPLDFEVCATCSEAKSTGGSARRREWAALVGVEP
mgnify:CR=1 FL=1